MRPLWGMLGTLLSSAVLLINNHGLSVQGPGVVCLWFGNVEQNPPWPVQKGGLQRRALFPTEPNQVWFLALGRVMSLLAVLFVGDQSDHTLPAPIGISPMPTWSPPLDCLIHQLSSSLD